MNGFLSNLAIRAVQPTRVLRPELPSIFGPPSVAPYSPFEMEAESLQQVANPAPDRMSGKKSEREEKESIPDAGVNPTTIGETLSRPALPHTQKMDHETGKVAAIQYPPDGQDPSIASTNTSRSDLEMHRSTDSKARVNKLSQKHSFPSLATGEAMTELQHLQSAPQSTNKDAALSNTDKDVQHRLSPTRFSTPESSQTHPVEEERLERTERTAHNFHDFASNREDTAFSTLARDLARLRESTDHVIDRTGNLEAAEPLRPVLPTRMASGLPEQLRSIRTTPGIGHRAGASSEQVVQVTIGRVEVHAPSQSTGQKIAQHQTGQAPLLAEYLRGRTGRGRG